MPKFWRNFKVKVRHSRGDEDKFNSFVKEYDAAMEIINGLSQEEKDTIKQELNAAVDGLEFGDAVFAGKAFMEQKAVELTEED